MHHLTAQSGTLTPLFKRAILMSPAFAPLFEPKRLNAQYQTFENKAGCKGLGLSCLRGKSSAVLQAANLGTALESPYGQFGYGPAVDNGFVKDLPSIELAKGNYFKDVSVLLGHVSNEGLIFTDPFAIFNSQVDDLIKLNFPQADAKILKDIETQYPEPGLFSTFLTNFDRVSTLIGEYVVSCNTRFLAAAYPNKAWAYRFSVPPGVHGFDLIFAFWRADLNIGQLLQFDFDIDFITQKNLATGFQSYITSFVRTGDPNTFREIGSLPPTQSFPKAALGENGVTMLDVNLFGYSTVTDPDTPRGRCSYWQSGSWTGR